MEALDTSVTNLSQRGLPRVLVYREVLKLLPCYLVAGCTSARREDEKAPSGSSFMKGTDARGP
jgi:hypothetical protein